jgi:hypothetical protein
MQHISTNTTQRYLASKHIATRNYFYYSPISQEPKSTSKRFRRPLHIYTSTHRIMPLFHPALYKNQAPTAPTTANAPDPTLTAAPVVGLGDALALAPAAPAFPPVVLAAGGLAGSATPLGQCQWSPCGEHVDARASGLAVGSGTPLGQCQWSPWGSQTDAEAAWSWS